MKSPRSNPSGKITASPRAAFTLVEMLVVMAIIAILAVLSVASIPALQDSGNITANASTLASTLENARAYAMANNTYVWVGFYEESNSLSSTGSTHNQQPPYVAPNLGRLVISVVAAMDGTQNLNTGNLVAIQKLTTFQNVHITNLNASLAPAASNSSLPNNLAGRPLADSFLDSENSAPNSQLPTGANGETFQMSNYQFYKAICFNHDGSVEMETPSKSLQHLIEIGLVSTHGGIVNTQGKNLIAIQITGVGGNVKTYRQ